MITLTIFNGETRQVKNGSSLLPLAQEFAKDFSTPIVEGVFKALGRVLGAAAAIDEKRAGEIPSTKGVIV